VFSGRQLTLGDYWLIVQRRKWWLGLPWVAIFIGAALWSFSLPDIYRASTLILVEAQQVPEAYVKATVSSPVQERLRTITQQIMSRTRLERVVAELSLMDSTQQDEKTVEDYIKGMRSRIEAEVKGQDSFTVSYMDKDPRTVMLVANKLASLFIEENLKVREQHVAGTTEFLADELRRVRARLEAQEKAITEFKQQNIKELPGQPGAHQQSLDQLQAELEGILEAIEKGQSRKNRLMQHLSTLQTNDVVGSSLNDALNNTLDIPSNAAASPLERQLAERRQALAELRMQFSDHYPDVRRLQQEVSELERQLAADQPKLQPTMDKKPAGVSLDGLRFELQAQITGLQEEMHHIDSQLQKLYSKQERIRARMAESGRTIASAAQREQDLMGLTRDYDTTRQNYDSLLAREMQAKVAENLEKRQKAEKFKVLDPAGLPSEPWTPKRGRIILMGVVLGLGIGCGAVFLTEYLDRSFHDPRELQQFTTLPVLATLPRIMTAVEQRKQRLKSWSFYTACVVLPVVAIAGVHFFWMRADLIIRRTLQLLNL
jgi:polysaccharide chain length determinant protein (PEP-CTERM system associated)